MMWIEHRLPQSQDPSLKNEYGNCLYSCQFCNRPRSNRPVEDEGKRLLDPTEVAWDNHFEVAGDHLKPRAGDKGAEYTDDCYHMNDPRKVSLRSLRRRVINDRRRLLVEGRGEENWLVKQAEQDQDDSEKVDRLLSLAAQLRRAYSYAEEELLQYRAIPEDAPSWCRCESTAQHSLPAWLESQTWELDR